MGKIKMYKIKKNSHIIMHIPFDPLLGIWPADTVAHGKMEYVEECIHGKGVCNIKILRTI